MLKCTDMTKTVFIDESGDLGTGGRFFIISCVVLSEELNRRWEKIARDYIRKYNKKKPKQKKIKEIKASNLSYKRKLEIVDRFFKGQEGLSIFLGIIDKKHKHFQNTFFGKQRENTELAFNYLIGKILDKGIADKFSDVKEWNLVIDERNVAIQGRNSLQDYLNINRLFPETKGFRVRTLYYDSKNLKGIQLADLIANIAFSKFEYKRSEGLFHKISGNIENQYKYPEC